MITLKQELERLIKNKPLLEEGLAKRLINLSALARFFKPQLQKNLYKKRVSNAALIMSLKRLQSKVKVNFPKSIDVKSDSELILRNNLIEYTFVTSKNLVKLQGELLSSPNAQDSYIGISRGTTETTFITSNQLSTILEKLYKNEKLVSKIDNLCAVTIRFSEKTITTPGVYYTILKALAWENINLIELVSNYRELTLIFDKKDIEPAFLSIRSVTS